MGKIHTHYDNLKVARNAPPEVIRAAYKSLAQMFHPDLNPGNEEASRIMKIINGSYAVLSDEEKRRAHDLWIFQQETGGVDAAGISYDSPAQKTPMPRKSGFSLGAHIAGYWGWYVMLAIFLYPALKGTSSPSPGPKPYQQQAPAPVVEKKLAYVRPALSPNKSPWPQKAGYVAGYPKLKTTGLSSVTVDNTQNDADVFVKLVSLDGTYASPVRHFFIPARDKFTVNKVTPGGYDVRYRDLDSGRLSRSESFAIEQTDTDTGTRYTNMTLTLYTVKNGNMQTYPLSEQEF